MTELEGAEMSNENERKEMLPLPKMLPQPALSASGDCVQWYTSDQMRAYGEACAKAEREACAALVRSARSFTGAFGEQEVTPTQRELAEKIRSRSTRTN